ncbi:MAG: right-handed parallel beta-helix repeat-containing protein [Candidatus Nanopelagicales bacterium]
MPQILRPALLAIVACTAVAGSALVGAPKAHAIGACPTLVQGTDFTTFSDLQTLFTAQRFCDEGSMTVDFTSDFTWPDDASLTWDGQDHQPLLLRGTGPNTPTVTGYKAAVIVNNSDGGLTVSNLTIKKGDVGQDNAIFGSVGNVVLNNATVLGRAGEANGRAIRTGDGDVSITNSTIKDNNTGSGAGVSVDGAHSVTITNSTISNNQATFQGGGGIYAETGTVTILNSTISGNSANPGSGGGIYLSGAGSIVVTNSTISGNSATSKGAGIESYGSVAITNSTVTGNTATDADASAGGLLGHGIDWNLKFATIADNTAGTGGGGNISDDVGSTAFTSIGSVIATAGQSSCTGITPGPTSTYNATATGDSSCGFGQSGGPGNFSATSGELNLGALAVNGNPSGTQTMLPNTGSTLINAVPAATGQEAIGPNATDQRSITRTGEFWVGAAQGTSSSTLAQTPAYNCVHKSVNVPRRGARWLMKANCVTNAGQKITVKASARTPRGDAKFFSVYRKRDGTTMIRTYGTKIKLTLTWSAAATGSYSAFKYRRTQTT